MSRCNTDISSCGQNVVGASMFPSTEGTGGDIRVPTNGIHMSEVCRLQRTVPGSVWAPALAWHSPARGQWNGWCVICKGRAPGLKPELPHLVGLSLSLGRLPCSHLENGDADSTYLPGLLWRCTKITPSKNIMPVSKTKQDRTKPNQPNNKDKTKQKTLKDHVPFFSCLKLPLVPSFPPLFARMLVAVT